MAKSKISRKILEISEGVFSSLTDLILLILTFGYESLLDQRFGRSLPYTLARLDTRMQKINYLSIKRAIKYNLEKGWIKENLELTKEGQQRLKRFFLEYYPPPKWDGNWYLVNFDIPEKLKRKRDILREYLRILGFGKLQNSIWISPYNFLGDIGKTIEEQNLTPYVILSISDKVGQLTSKMLAEKVWKISEIQEEYQKFIAEFKEKINPSPLQVFFQYHSILQRDPRLPKELLPEDWPGEAAYELYSKLTKTIPT